MPGAAISVKVHPGFVVVSDNNRVQGAARNLTESPQSFLYISASRYKLIDEDKEPILAVRTNASGLELLACWGTHRGQNSYDLFEIRFPLDPNPDFLLPTYGGCPPMASVGYLFTFERIVSDNGRELIGLGIRISSIRDKQGLTTLECFAVRRDPRGTWSAAPRLLSQPKGSKGTAIFGDVPSAQVQQPGTGTPTESPSDDLDSLELKLPPGFQVDDSIDLAD